MVFLVQCNCCEANKALLTSDMLVICMCVRIVTTKQRKGALLNYIKMHVLRTHFGYLFSDRHLTMFAIDALSLVVSDPIIIFTIRVKYTSRGISRFEF